MDVYESLYDLTSCKDLVQFGKKLIEFSDAASLEKNRATVVKRFYEQITSFAFADYIFSDSDSKYITLQGNRAIAFYINLKIPPCSSPAKSIKAIRSIGQQITTEFVPPIGKIISHDKISEIMMFLDDNYSFSSKVFSDQKAAFLILENSNKEYDSECFAGFSKNKIIQHLFLYHMKSNDPSITPEGVLFHELGHALHARYAGAINVVPENIIKLFAETFFPKYDLLSLEEQSEVLADALSMGLMYNSPFSKYDPFTSIDDDGKEFFNLLAKKMVASI